MQPITGPSVDAELVGKRIEVCFEYEMNEEGENNLAWCQGVVVAVSDGTNLTRRGNEILDGTKGGGRRAMYKAGEAARIRWDSVLEGESEVTNESLLPSKWNPKGRHRKGCWRFDLSGKE